MAHQYMPKIFHGSHKNPLTHPPPTYLMYGPLARLNQSTKYMLKVATEMQLNIQNKAPERCQRCC